MNPFVSTPGAIASPPLHHLVVELPYRRNLLDRVLEIAILPLVALFSMHPPRKDVLELQLRQLIGDIPPRFHNRIHSSALREIFRLLGRGWSRLDLSPLEDIPESPWKKADGPVLFLSMHHGQWEWLAGILTRLRPGALCIARAPGHPLGRRLLSSIRDHVGLRMVHDLESVRAGRRQLRAGGLVAFLADQRPPGAFREGTWMGQPTRVTRLPEWWTEGRDITIWTGVLHPGRTSYTLELKAWSSDHLSRWDALLDQEFLPLLRRSPWDHFGLWHHRLKSRAQWRITESR